MAKYLRNIINIFLFYLSCHKMVGTFKFVDEIIVSKIKDNRHKIKLDIHLNLFYEDKTKKKGSKHINGPLNNDYLYIKNKKYTTIDNICKRNTPNNFTYNVYIELS